MNLVKLGVNETLNKAESLLKEEQGLSSAMRAVIEILILFVRTFLGRLSINRNNRSVPPSSDKNRKSIERR